MTLWEETQKNLILKVMSENDFVKTRAAQVLGISIRTLRNKIRDFGIQKECRPLWDWERLEEKKQHADQSLHGPD